MTTDVLPEQTTVNSILATRFLDRLGKSRAKRVGKLNADKALQALEDVAAWLETKPEMGPEIRQFFKEDVNLLSLLLGLDSFTPANKEATS